MTQPRPAPICRRLNCWRPGDRAGLRLLPARGAAAASPGARAGRDRTAGRGLAGHHASLRRSARCWPVGHAMTDQPLRIGNFSGFYGDRFEALAEMLAGGELDVLTGDYL